MKYLAIVLIIFIGLNAVSLSKLRNSERGIGKNNLLAKLAEGAMYELSQNDQIRESVKQCLPVHWKLAGNTTSIVNITTSVQDLDNYLAKIKEQEFSLDNFKLFLTKTIDYACTIKEDVIKFFTPKAKRRVLLSTEKTKTKWNIYNFVRDNDELIKKKAREIKSGSVKVREPNPADKNKLPASVQTVTTDAAGNKNITTVVYEAKEKTVEYIYEKIIEGLKERIKPALDQFEDIRTQFQNLFRDPVITRDFKYTFNCLVEKKNFITEKFITTGNNFFNVISSIEKDDSKIRFPLRLLCGWSDSLEALNNYNLAKDSTDQSAKYIYYGKFIGRLMSALGK